MLSFLANVKIKFFKPILFSWETNLISRRWTESETTEALNFFITIAQKNNKRCKY